MTTEQPTLVEAWERVLEAAVTARQNLADCTDDCNHRARADARLEEIRLLAERALSSPSGGD